MNAVAQAVTTAVRVWSSYQNGFFDWVVNGTGNAVVIAVAGSGKTTSGVEAVKRLPVGRSHVYLAFNKSIADELSKRGVNGSTFHKLCYKAVLNARGVSEVTTDKEHGGKLRQIIDGFFETNDLPMYASFVNQLVKLAKNAGIDALVEDTEQAWSDLADHHDLQLDHVNARWERAIDLARQTLQRSNSSHMVDFDDLLYFAVRDGLVLPKYDFIFVDEAQDTNAIQRAIIRKLFNKSDSSNPFASSIPSRLVAIGDPAQAIYGFRGADSNSIELIKQEFDAIELPLTVSYRCPRKVVEYVQQWCPHIEAAPNAIEGDVRELGLKWKPSDFKPDDMVVSRFTRPAVSLAYTLLKDRVAAYVVGREIGEGLRGLIRKMNAKGIDALVDRLEDWTAREVEKAIAKKDEGKAQAIQDKTDCILFLIDSMEETRRTIPALNELIDELFRTRENAVKISTIHRGKGLEARNVWWLNGGAPAGWAKREWQQKQEVNLCYVAGTRAMEVLTIFEEHRKYS
jgi:superfamily I DNA/RNA helicase